MKAEEIKELSMEELRKNLITTDWRGKTVKELMLDEIIRRVKKGEFEEFILGR